MKKTLSPVIIFAFLIAIFFAANAWAAPEAVSKNAGTKEISVTFSTPMDTSSVMESFNIIVNIAGLGYGTLAGELEMDDTGTSARFVPVSDFVSGLNYEVTLSGAKDTSGNALDFGVWSFTGGDDGLPVIAPQLDELPVRFCAISAGQLRNIYEQEGNLFIDLGDDTFSGNIYVSPYPFGIMDSDYDYAYYSDRIGALSEGIGEIPLSDIYVPKYDVNGWLEGLSPATPTISYRLELFQGEDSYTGIYGSFLSFEKTEDGFRKMPSIIDGPFVTMISSDDPTSVEIVWETDEACSGRVVSGSSAYDDENGETMKHNVRITGLMSDTEYEYYAESVSSDGRKVRTKAYTFRTAPEKGQGDVTFAYASDSRTGSIQIGEWNYAGVNAAVIQEVAASAYQEGADFFIFGGDEIFGFSDTKDDLSLQFKAWKECMAGFWRTRPVYAGMGNHEYGARIFSNYSFFDRWPYDTESGEAVFASEFFNPTNGPVPSDPRRPTYDENVFHFQYGPVKVISFNNTYWMSFGLAYHSVAAEFGGSPAGYVMEDQLEWIEKTMEDAENDPTVKFIFLFAHSPVYPSMGHFDAAMWWEGDNNIRPFTKNSETGKLEPEALGLIEVRNRLWKSVAQSSKVAAVFTGDEHAYHRTLINSETPVGVYPGDDTDGDGKLDKYSPNPEFTNPVWHITCGGGGAPYVAEREPVPWEPEVVTSNIGYVLIKTQGDKVSMQFVANPVGGTGEVLDELYYGDEEGRRRRAEKKAVREVLDEVEDLMSVKE